MIEDYLSERYEWVIRKNQPKGQSTWFFSPSETDHLPWMEMSELEVVLYSPEKTFNKIKYDTKFLVKTKQNEIRKINPFQALFRKGEFVIGIKNYSSEKCDKAEKIIISAPNEFKRELQKYFGCKSYKEISDIIKKSNLPSIHKISIRDLIDFK